MWYISLETGETIGASIELSQKKNEKKSKTITLRSRVYVNKMLQLFLSIQRKFLFVSLPNILYFHNNIDLIYQGNWKIIIEIFSVNEY